MRVVEALIFITALGSLLVTIVNLLTAPRLRRGARPLSLPRVSVIIPARNEERIIERTVRAMLAQTYETLEVIVVDDRSNDSTGSILRALADPRLIVVHGDEPPPGWLGKPWALSQGSGRATGELLLFVDADVIYAPDAIAAAVADFEKRGAGLVSFFPQFELRGFWENVLMPNLAECVFSIFPLVLANRSRRPVLALGGGPGNLVSRETYDAVGGHEALRGEIVDDVGLARLVRRSGKRTEAVRADDLISLRMYHGFREIVEGFTKNSFAAFNRRYGATIVITFVVLIANLLPYVMALRGDGIAIATVVAAVAMRVLVSASFRYRLDVALVAQPFMAVVWSWIMLRSMWITGIKRQLAWRGRSYDSAATR
jgi:glycosyltransferase involved in cell wall biosynthesis